MFGILALTIGLVSVIFFKAKPSEQLIEKDNYKILKKWELPAALNEISGITWIGEDRVACVQDENGIIYIYNLRTSKVEDEIMFGEDGDYEGIAVIENDAYVLRSDGTIIEVSDFMGNDPQVKSHETEVNRLPGINLEGLCADPTNNRLLMAVKERKNFNEHKEIFAFDLDNKHSAAKALFRIDLSDPIFNKVKDKLEKKFKPGEINIHPKTGELFILDGTRPKLLITEKDGTPKELFMLTTEKFGNPEGLTFSPAGELYISNEAESDPANILKISLNRKTQ